MPKLASQADLWYNEVSKLLSLSDAGNILRREFNLSRRRTVDTLPHSAQNDKHGTETTFIYALIDPNTHQVRYVGKSDSPHHRLKAHIRESTRRPEDRHYSTHKANWIRSLIQDNKMPVLQIVEEVSQEEWKERECYWIDFYRSQGCNLTNIAPGGIAHDYSPETIAKRVAKMKGRPLTEEHKKKIGEAGKGRQATQRMREVFAAHNKTPKSEQTRKRISEAQIGRVQSQSTRDKISTANKGRGHSHAEETKQILREKNRGRIGPKCSDATKAKIRDAYYRRVNGA